MFQPNDEAVAAPKLNIMAIDEALGLGGCLEIVGANQRPEADEMPVEANDISSVFSHRLAPSKQIPLALTRPSVCPKVNTSQVGHSHFLRMKEAAN
jgi:hypothetical protein